MDFQKVKNKYDEYFDFRQARKSDIDSLMKFIDTHWKKGHILGTDREFFEYEFADGENVQFIIVLKKGTNEIVGHTGYILYSPGEAVAGVMTMVLNDLPIPMVGVELLRRFMEMVPHKDLVSVGVNPTTMLPLANRIFKMKTGKMSHFYMLDQRDEFKIAKISQKQGKTIKSKPVKAYREVKDFADLAQNMDLTRRYPNLPYKGPQYIEKRYFNHPIYCYRSFIIKSADNQTNLVIGREVKAEGSKVFRIVDYVGDTNYIDDIGMLSENLLSLGEYEYIDFLVGGLPNEKLLESGFSLRKEDDENIIPTYFEPFVRQNVDIWYEFKNQVVVFKGDADGDRPSTRI